MSDTIWGVVCIHPNGHRTIVRTSEQSGNTKDQLEAWGAPPLDADADADAAAWLRAWLPRLTQPLRHPGCHKYAWALDRAPSARRVSLPAAPAIPG